MIKFGYPWAVGLEVGILININKEIINVNFTLSSPNWIFPTVSIWSKKA